MVVKIKLIYAKSFAWHRWLMALILDTCQAELEDLSLRTAQANSSRDPISKITRAKWTGDVAYMVECLLCEGEP
jgi:hypothetical protein